MLGEGIFPHHGCGMASENTIDHAKALEARTSSGAFRGVLVGSAVLLALLPIPVTALQLLPVYAIHGRFLTFYTPLICLLLVAYLFHVRDALARLMFADILRPLPEQDPYYRESASDSARRWLRRVQAFVLALLPALLLVGSFLCMTRYTARLKVSVELAEAPAPGQVKEEEVGVAGLDSAASMAARQLDARTRGVKGGLKRSPGSDSVAVADSLPIRVSVLQTTGIDDIPLFTELTVLYIGIFGTALAAVILMALKEHAKVAMGLSEEDLMLRDWSPAGALSEEHPMVSRPGQ
jgi:hypothetical protein